MNKNEPIEPDRPAVSSAVTGSVSEGQSWIVEYLCALRPWLRKATWEDMCAKMRSHAPDIYRLLSERGKTPNGVSATACSHIENKNE